MLDEAAIFLARARQEAGHIDEGDQRDREAIAEAHEARRLAAGIGIEHAGEHHRLVGDKADGGAFDAAEADDDVLRETLLELEELALVGDLHDQFLDVVGLVGGLRHQAVERGLLAFDWIVGGDVGDGRAVRQRQEIDQAAHLAERHDVVVIGAVGDRGACGVHRGAAELFRGDGFVGDGLHHVRAGDEHVGGVAHHEDEVGDRRRIDVAAGARPHDDGNLRDDAGGEHIVLEHAGITAERRHTLLDAGAAGIEKADDRRAVLERHLLQLLDLLGMGLRQRAAEDGEILGEDEDQAAVDRAPAGDHAVAGELLLGHAEIDRAVLDEDAVFLERALVEQRLDAFAGGELAALVLGRDALLAAAEMGLGPAPGQFVDDLIHGHFPPALQK